jgi:hypothetical protein
MLFVKRPHGEAVEVPVSKLNTARPKGASAFVFSRLCMCLAAPGVR